MLHVEVFLAVATVSTSVACALGPSVTMSSTDFAFQKTWFFGIYLN